MDGGMDGWMGVLRVLKLAMKLTSPHLCFYFSRGVQVHTKKKHMWTQLVEQSRNCTKTIRVERFGDLNVGYLVFVCTFILWQKQVNCLTYRLNVLPLNILLYLTF